MVLIRYLKTTKDEDNSFQVPRHYKTQEHLKNERKRQNSHMRDYQKRPCTLTFYRTFKEFCALMNVLGHLGKL